MRIAISGINRGLGEAIAQRCLSQGDEVVGFGRSNPSWASGGAERFEFIQCDMADYEALADGCSKISSSVDVLICNAATFATGAGTIEEFHPMAMVEAFAVNTVAPLIMARSLKKHLERGERRLIIMMSSGNASLEGNTTGSLLGYRLSKTALNQAVRNLAAEWGPQGFAVVALNPGWVRTDMGGPNAPLSVEEASEQILNFIRTVSVSTTVNGCFLNADGSRLSW